MQANFTFEADNLATEWNKKIVPVRHNLADHPLFTGRGAGRADRRQSAGDP
jgi:hypothetical protein